ncbi:hypothetical protein DFH27DRAFT_634702 [Peziza echinospora]|nr:hypothetical protein DFH27DRAFT_634702 [Peziza echinospora]
MIGIVADTQALKGMSRVLAMTFGHDSSRSNSKHTPQIGRRDCCIFWLLRNKYPRFVIHCRWMFFALLQLSISVFSMFYFLSQQYPGVNSSLVTSNNSTTNPTGGGGGSSNRIEWVPGPIIWPAMNNSNGDLSGNIYTTHGSAAANQGRIMVDAREYRPVIYLGYPKTWSYPNMGALIAGWLMYGCGIVCYICVCFCGDFLDKPEDPDEVKGKKEGEVGEEVQAGNNRDGNCGNRNNVANRPVAAAPSAVVVVQGNNNNDNPGGGANAVPVAAPAPAGIDNNAGQEGMDEVNGSSGRPSETWNENSEASQDVEVLPVQQPRRGERVTINALPEVPNEQRPSSSPPASIGKNTVQLARQETRQEVPGARPTPGNSNIPAQPNIPPPEPTGIVRATCSVIMQPGSINSASQTNPQQQVNNLEPIPPSPSITVSSTSTLRASPLPSSPVNEMIIRQGPGAVAPPQGAPPPQQKDPQQAPAIPALLIVDNGVNLQPYPGALVAAVPEAPAAPIEPWTEQQKDQSGNPIAGQRAPGPKNQVTPPFKGWRRLKNIFHRGTLQTHPSGPRPLPPTQCRHFYTKLLPLILALLAAAIEIT